MSLAAFSAPMAAPAPKRAVPAPATIARVEAAPFQLTQVETRKVSQTESRSLYRGQSTLTVAACGGTTAPEPLPVMVELRTMTTLNACGDGLTDGWLALYDASHKVIVQGPLMAINGNFGELTGVIEGRMFTRYGAPNRLRVIFNGTFVQDNAGEYTLVDVTSRGVLIAMPQPGKGTGGRR